MALPLRAPGAQLAPYKWKPGQSGNPAGTPGWVKQCRDLAHQLTDEAWQTLRELLHSEDDRVRAVAVKEVFDRAYGKPKEQSSGPDDALRAMSNAELAVKLREAAAHLELPEAQEAQTINVEASNAVEKGK